MVLHLPIPLEAQGNPFCFPQSLPSLYAFGAQEIANKIPNILHGFLNQEWLKTQNQILVQDIKDIRLLCYLDNSSNRMLFSGLNEDNRKTQLLF